MTGLPFLFFFFLNCIVGNVFCFFLFFFLLFFVGTCQVFADTGKIVLSGLIRLSMRGEPFDRWFLDLLNFASSYLLRDVIRMKSFDDLNDYTGDVEALICVSDVDLRITEVYVDDSGDDHFPDYCQHGKMKIYQLQRQL